MNIGFFTDTYTPLVDGVVRSILTFRTALENAGHTVYVFAPAVTKEGRERYGEHIDPPDDERVFRFKAIDSAFLPGYPVGVPISFKASKAIPTLELDVVHCHSPVLVGLLGDLVAFLANVPKVYTYHTYYKEYSRSYIMGGQELTPKMVEEYERLYMHRSDAVITPSEKLAQVLQDEYRYEGVADIIPTGVDLDEFTGVTPAAFYGLFPQTKGKRVLLFAGRLGKEKNIELLIDMMRFLPDKDVCLVIAGTGRWEQDLMERARSGIDRGTIVFTGLLTRTQMLSAYAAASVFVFPSLTDTQGMVLSEAVVSGVPVVHVDAPSLSTALVDGATSVYTKNDPHAFATSVEVLLSDVQKWRRMREACFAHAGTLSIQHSLSQIEAVYDRVVDEYDSESWRTRAKEALQKEVTFDPFVSGMQRGTVHMKEMVKRGKRLGDALKRAKRS